jgi:hypothetical protein
MADGYRNARDTNMTAETRYRAHAVNMLVGFVGVRGGRVTYTQAYDWVQPQLGSDERFENTVLTAVKDGRLKLVNSGKNLVLSL